MLVLSRKENEVIQIGEAITIKVVLLAGRRVKLAIDAPREVRVMRGELQTEPPTPDRPCVDHKTSALMAHAES